MANLSLTSFFQFGSIFAGMNVMSVFSTCAFVVLLASPGFGQSVDTVDGFRWDGSNVIWQMVYSQPDMDKLELLTALSKLNLDQFTINHDSSSVTATPRTVLPDYTYDGFSGTKWYRNTSLVGQVRIDVKDGRYRVTQYNLSLVRPQGMFSEGSGEESFTASFCNTRRHTFNKPWINELKAYHRALSSLFDISASDPASEW
jgi:hypothetical protein